MSTARGRATPGGGGAIGAGVDWLVRRVSERLAAADARAPATRALAELRRDALERALAAHRDEAVVLAPALARGDAAAREALVSLAERALAAMRREADAAAGGLGGRHALLGAADRAWRSSTATELLDDPEFDRAARTRILGKLDALNDALGSYAGFLDALRPCLRRDGRPTRILDLAAGHGGFALALARHARDAGVPLEVTATDLKREYLDLGAERARAEGLPVRFEVQDALDLSTLPAPGAPDAYDVLTCTQSLHHFPAGRVALMFEAATRAAARGVVFVDGCRSALAAAPVVALCLARWGDPVFAHDAFVSFRRFFVPEELELLVRLGPWGDGVRVRWVPPGHCLVRWRRAGLEHA